MPLTLAVNLGMPALVLVAAICALAVLGALRVLATWVEQEQGIHDLRVRSHELRRAMQRRLAQREGLIPYDEEELGEVEVLDDDDPRAMEMTQAAVVPSEEVLVAEPVEDEHARAA